MLRTVYIDNEDNTSLLFYSEVEKLITKATSEEKFTTALERLKQWKRTAQLQQRKKNPRKENSKSHMQKKKKQDYSGQISHRREFPSKAEMVNTTGQEKHFVVMNKNFLLII